MSLVHYVRRPGGQGMLYPMCGRRTWQTPEGWKVSSLNFSTCFACLLAMHSTYWPADYQFMERDVPFEA